MSTYGTALVIDSPNGSGLAALGTKLASERADVYWARAHDGWSRLTVAWEGVDHVSAVRSLLEVIGTGRAAVAEDNDAFGAHWAVLSAVDGVVQTVHRRYLLNADPQDEAEVAALVRSMGGSDPRAFDDAGESAAAAAGVLFGVDPAAVVEAERDSASAHLRMGVIGGPFPWWPALGLPWPGPDAGEPVLPDLSSTKLVRMNRATWPRFATRHLLPHLPEPERWEVTNFGAIRHPSRWLAQGLAWNGSSGDWFYGLAMLFPLFVPTEHIYFNYAQELSDHRGHRGFDLPTRDTIEETGRDLARAVIEQGIEHLDRVGSLDGFAQLLIDKQAEMRAEGRTARAHAEPLGYTLVLLGREREAADQLSIAQEVDPEAPDWVKASGRRAALIAQLVHRDPQAAVKQLDAWAQQSADLLKINRVASPPS